MKVFIVMGGFFPGKKYGGPPVSIENLASLVCNNQYFIVTTNHDLGDSAIYQEINNGWNKRKENMWIKYLPDNEYNSSSFNTAILEIKPDIVYLQGLFQRCVVPLLRLAKKYSIPVLLAPRGELCAGAFKKKYKKIPYIIYLRSMGLIKRISFQSTSKEETFSIIKYLKVSPNSIFFLNNIPSIPPKLTVLTQKKNPGSARIVFLSRIVPKKNLLFAIQALRSISGDVSLDIYGPIEDSEYWEQCNEEIKRLPQNVRVKYLGILSHEEIHSILSSYHAFLFPTLSENYGHVIIESMLSGCIPIISDQTPWTDLNDWNCGWALSLGSVTCFTKAIQIVVDMNSDSLSIVKNRLMEYVSQKLMLDETKNMYQDAFVTVARKATK